MESDVWYTIFEKRYRTDPQRATALVTVDTLEEARAEVKFFNNEPFGYDPVIVRMVWSDSAGGYVEAGIVE